MNKYCLINCRWVKYLNLAWLLFIFSSNVSASMNCSFGSGSHKEVVSYTMPTDGISVPADVTPGTVIWESGWVEGNSVTVVCSRSFLDLISDGIYSVGYASAMTLVPGYSDVYETTNPSIGVRVYFSNTKFDGYDTVLKYPPATSTFGPNTFIPSANFNVQLIAIARLQSVPITLPSPTAQVKYQGLVTNELTIIGGTFNVKAVACNLLTTGTLQVPLEEILATELKGVGTTAKPKSFSIALECDAQARISLRLAGEAAPGHEQDGVLKLTDASDAAQGVGIQVLSDSKPLIINQYSSFATATGGSHEINFTAQYYQTADALYGGVANSTATLEIAYR